MGDSNSTTDSQASKPSTDKAAFYFEDDSGSEDSADSDVRHIRVGICAMSKKSHSKPMLEILERLILFENIKPVIFDEDVILNEPIENWPVCDCLISFHSSGFPLNKAVKYAELRKPMVINDLYMQYKIQDRQVIHEILSRQEIDQPRYVVLDRDKKECNLIEAEDLIEVNNMIFHKPFVEKPLFAEDHNVYIYFPSSAGGGSQRLFRKIGSRSSVYSPVSTTRKTGSFVYEEFMPTDGTDVKVYTVGPDYAHAEARKSPALDGKVERDKDGKEVRYPVILSAAEKLIARKVCLAFKQMVCGFDLLRANGRSYVCDVNGFSFVKTSMKYYDDCAKILGNMILRQLAPQLHIPYSITYQPEDIPIVPTTYGTMMELRNVIAVIRHGDRTPKQKMKMEVRHKKFFDLFDKYGGFKSGQLKLKRPKQLQEVLDIARFLLSEIRSHSDPEIEEKKSKLDQLKTVLEMYGHFSGINRKVQLKYQPHGNPKKSSDDDDNPREPSLVLILKWGGELTPAGKIQAEELGKAFRYMYPGGQGDYGHTPGLGILRLHSTFRHDLKIYASDEGRVQMTAAAFAKGFLALEGELTPILVQMVKSANMNGLLDNDNESSKYQNIFGSLIADNPLTDASGHEIFQEPSLQDWHRHHHHIFKTLSSIVKEKLQCLMNFEGKFGEEECEKLATTGSASLTEAIKFVGNPYATCETIYNLMNELLEKMKEMKADVKYREMVLYHSETWELLIRRWSKLTKDFRMKNDQYDISKIPDIYDCVKYDLLHNKKVLRDNGLNQLHGMSKAMADIVIPQEYGITREEKMLISQCICTPLLRKILVDLQRNVDEGSTRLDYRYSKGITTPHRHVRTRLYFTSESHIHSLLTIIRYGGLLDAADEQWTRAMDYVNAVSELNYMTQIVIMMYEDPTKDPLSDERFHVELHFSPGAYTLGKGTDIGGQGYRTQIKDSGARVSTPCKAELHDKIAQHMAEQLKNNGLESFDETQETDRSCSTDTLTSTSKSDTNSDSGQKSDATDAGGVANKQDKTKSLSASRLRHHSGETTGSPTDKNKLEAYSRVRHHSGDNLLHNALHKQDEFQYALPPHRNSFSGLFIPNTPDKLTMAECKNPMISTKVISGSSSAPNLLEIDSSTSSQAEGWKVPSIRPLETLHNSLTLRQLENFLIKMTEGSFRTPVPTPPYPPSTPCSSMVNSANAQTLTNLGLTSATGYNLSSSVGSSDITPGAYSHPDDIVRRLRQLMESTSLGPNSTPSEYLPTGRTPSVSASSDVMEDPGTGNIPCDVPCDVSPEADVICEADLSVGALDAIDGVDLAIGVDVGVNVGVNVGVGVTPAEEASACIETDSNLSDTVNDSAAFNIHEDIASSTTDADHTASSNNVAPTASDPIPMPQGSYFERQYSDNNSTGTTTTPVQQFSPVT